MAFSKSFGDRLPYFSFLTKFSSGVPSITSSGSMTFPLVLDIFSPFLSHTIGCRKTVLNGNFPVSHRLIITILATQKNRMSCPVYKMLFGKNCLKSGWVSSGQLKTENGKRPELNQVSRTSSSWWRVISSSLRPVSLIALSIASLPSLPTTHVSLVVYSPFF